MFVCMFVCMFICMFVCMFICMFVCMHGTLLSEVNQLSYKWGASVFEIFETHPAVTRSTNNRITCCSYYVQLYASQCEQTRAIVDNVMRLFFDCPSKVTSLQFNITASITSRFLELERNNQYIDWQQQVPSHRWKF